MKMPEDYQVPDEPRSMDAAFLRTLLGMKTLPGGKPQPLPVAVRRAHFIVARWTSLLGMMSPGGMDPAGLRQVMGMAMRFDRSLLEKATEDPPETTFTDVVAQELVKPGDKVKVRYQKQWGAGHYLETLPDGRILVLHGGHERKFTPTSVRRVESGEFPEVADNINQPVGA